MTKHNIFCCPYSSFKYAQLPVLKVAAVYFDNLVIIDRVGASWDAVGANHHDAPRQVVASERNRT